jgi:2-keto-4-pentenoate hydratase
MSDRTKVRNREHAGRLFRAAAERMAIPPLTDMWPSLTLANAYNIQTELIGLHVAEGAKVVGAKLGFTSATMRDAMGVGEPNYGWLTNRMLLEGSSLSFADFIHPRVEPEIAFRLNAPLRGPGVTPRHVVSATASVFAALEIVDSRFVDYRFRLPDKRPTIHRPPLWQAVRRLRLMIWIWA